MGNSCVPRNADFPRRFSSVRPSWHTPSVSMLSMPTTLQPSAMLLANSCRMEPDSYGCELGKQAPVPKPGPQAGHFGKTEHTQSNPTTYLYLIQSTAKKASAHQSRLKILGCLALIHVIQLGRTWRDAANESTLMRPGPIAKIWQPLGKVRPETNCALSDIII
jgi:hypothetical protein